MAARLSAITRSTRDSAFNICAREQESKQASALTRAQAALGAIGLSLKDEGSYGGVPYYSVIGGSAKGGDAMIAVRSEDSVEAVLLRAQLAERKLPDAVVAFRKTLPDRLHAAFDRLFQDAKFRNRELVFGEQPISLLRQTMSQIELKGDKLELVLNGGMHGAKGSLSIECTPEGMLQLTLRPEGQGHTRPDLRIYFMSGRPEELRSGVREGMRPRPLPI
jgi:hypothetical protein